MGIDTAKKQRFDDIISGCGNDWNAAIDRLTEILEEGVASNDIYLIAAANYWLGVTNFRAGKRTELLPYALRAASFFAESDDHEMSARSYNLLAIIYTLSEECLLANDAFDKAYRILVEHPCDGFKLSTILNNYSANSFHLGDVKKAIRYAEESLSLLERDDPNYHRILFMLGENLSWYYEELGDSAKALEYVSLMEKAIHCGADLPEDIAYYHVRLSELALSQGDVEKGILYADKVIGAGDIDMGEHEPQRDYERIVEAFLKMDDHDRAYAFIRFLKVYADNSGILFDRILYFRTRSRYSEAAGDDKDVLLCLKELNRCYEEKAKESLATEQFIQKQTGEALDEVKDLLKTVRENEAGALTDGLTGFFNKSGAERYAGEFCNSGTGALAILDLDNFKLVNDIYGHQAGDDVLKSFSHILRKRCESEDMLFRIGGDEFLACLAGDLDDSVIGSITGYLNTHLTERCKDLFGDDFNIPIGTSVGAAFIPQGGCKYPDLFRLADKALYHAKQNGKHSYAIYHDNDSQDGEKGTDPGTELSRMKTIISERGIPHNAMMVGQDAFVWIYRYMERFSIRHQSDISVCLITIGNNKGIDNGIFQEEVSRFKEYLQNNLRRNDLMMDQKKGHIFLMLPDLPAENINGFIERIQKGWDKSGTRSVLSIEYHF